ncbi:MAG: trehalose-phosphatase [Deltaproteobacteria bacterium]|nr:trehalose-phosphatase [Deltaproteobacteria bacterium]
MRRGAGYRRLWVFDFDGTLSPIVPVRTEARMHPACRSLLLDLVRAPGNMVAILSSRSLEDLLPRVPVPRVFLGGGSGLEWRLHGGQRILPGRDEVLSAKRGRTRIAPVLKEISSIPGTDLEDKGWSIAVHYRKVSPEARTTLGSLLEKVRRKKEIRMFEGPAVAEIQLVPGWEKSLGLASLCRFLRFDPSGGRIVYAGDDENDGTAMRWAISRKGTALAVGIRPRVPGARVVSGPAALANAVRRIACLSGREEGEKRGAACR